MKKNWAEEQHQSLENKKLRDTKRGQINLILKNRKHCKAYASDKCIQISCV